MQEGDHEWLRDWGGERGTTAGGCWNGSTTLYTYSTTKTHIPSTNLFTSASFGCWCCCGNGGRRLLLLRLASAASSGRIFVPRVHSSPSCGLACVLRIDQVAVTLSW